MLGDVPLMAMDIVVRRVDALVIGGIGVDIGDVGTLGLFLFGLHALGNLHVLVADGVNDLCPTLLPSQ